MFFELVFWDSSSTKHLLPGLDAQCGSGSALTGPRIPCSSIIPEPGRGRAEAGGSAGTFFVDSEEWLASETPRGM